jgi:hypothetical protein
MAKGIQDGDWLGGFEAFGMVTFIHDIQVALGIGWIPYSKDLNEFKF